MLYLYRGINSSKKETMTIVFFSGYCVLPLNSVAEFMLCIATYLQAGDLSSSLKSASS